MTWREVAGEVGREGVMTWREVAGEVGKEGVMTWREVAGGSKAGRKGRGHAGMTTSSGEKKNIALKSHTSVQY